MSQPNKHDKRLRGKNLISRQQESAGILRTISSHPDQFTLLTLSVFCSYSCTDRATNPTFAFGREQPPLRGKGAFGKHPTTLRARIGGGGCAGWVQDIQREERVAQVSFGRRWLVCLPHTDVGLTF